MQWLNFLKFPLSGATAANQYEGAYNLDGKGLSVQDVTPKGGVPAKPGDRNPLITEGPTADNLKLEGIDFYHRYKGGHCPLCGDGLQGLPDYCLVSDFSKWRRAGAQ